MAQEYHVGTPEAIDIAYPIAGIGSRFLAEAIDSVIQIILMVLIILGAVGIAQIPGPGESVAIVIIVTAISLLLLCAYYILFEFFWSGQTPGKRLLKLRVIKTSGYPIGFADAAIRNLLRLVDWLPSLYGVGVVTMFINPQSRRLGDLVAGTLVVRERKQVRVQDLQASAGRAPGGQMTSPLGGLDPDELLWDLRALTQDDLQVINEYLDRAPTFSKRVRERVGRDVAEMAARRIGAREPLAPEPFLRRVLDLQEML